MAFRDLGLALLLPFVLGNGGCCTVMMWDAAPRLWPQRLLGATVAADGSVTLGVLLGNGARRAYRLECGTGQFGFFVPVGPWRLPDGAIDPAASVDLVDRNEDRGDRIPFVDGMAELHSDHPATPTIRPGEHVLIDGIWPSGSVFVVPGHDPERVVQAWCADRGSIDWTAGLTWATVAATPVSVAVDVVTFPVQLVMWCFVWPTC